MASDENKPDEVEATEETVETVEPDLETVDEVDDSQQAEQQTAPVRRRDRPAPADLIVRARAKHVRMSARKARLVCNNIRGKSVAEARAILAHTPRAAAESWSKLLESAIANAEHNHEIDGEDLRVLAVYADEGPTLKRFRPRAQGRASAIHKRTAHLSIALAPKED